MEEPGLIATEAVMDHPVGAEAVGRDVAIFAARIRAYGDARAQAERERCRAIVHDGMLNSGHRSSLLARIDDVDSEAILAADARPIPTAADHQQTTTRAGASEPPPARPSNGARGQS
jgi:uncharacterized membrane protein